MLSGNFFPQITKNQLKFESLTNCVVYHLSKQSYQKNKTISQENFINLVAVAVVLAIVHGHPSNKRVDS